MFVRVRTVLSSTRYRRGDRIVGSLQCCNNRAVASYSDCYIEKQSVNATPLNSRVVSISPRAPLQ